MLLKILQAWVLKTLIILSILGVGFKTASAQQSLPIVKPVMSCANISKVNFSHNGNVDADIKITAITEMQTSQGTFCKVSATLSPDIGVEVALPQAKWTQRMLQVGCGGLCGGINLSISNASGCTPAMNGEFTVAATNMGHSGSMMEAAWGEDPQKRIDFAYRANHVTAQFTKALIQAYYGQPQKYAYFMGCSDGGREALVEAQRYPHDFNGITAGAPAAWFSTQNSFYHGWNVTANLRSDGSPILLQNRLALIHQAVITHCSTLSGVNDGVLNNPFACRFSRNWIKQCSAGQTDRSDCLSTEELDVVERLYNGAKDKQGHQFVPGGLVIGSELRWPAPATSNGTSFSEQMALPALQYVLMPGSKQKINKVSDFQFNSSNFQKIAELAPLYNATNTNLKPYQEAGGKLMVWHGLADDSISPAGTIAYFRGVQDFMGEKQVDTFMRLFLLPGVAHCGNGEGPDQVDLLSAIMAWTEDGSAPEMLLTGKREHVDSMPMTPPSIKPSNQGAAPGDAAVKLHGIQKPSIPVATQPPQVTMNRPVYPFPFIAQYNGNGNINDAANYHAVKSHAYESIKLNKPISDMLKPNNQRIYQVVDGKLQSQ